MVDKSKVSVLRLLVSACQLASRRHGVKLQHLINHVFSANGCVKEGHFSLSGAAEV